MTELDLEALKLAAELEKGRNRTLTYRSCRHPMTGFYGVESECARPKGHWGEHYQVYGSMEEDRFLSTFTPATILALIERVQRAERVIEAAAAFKQEPVWSEDQPIEGQVGHALAERIENLMSALAAYREYVEGARL